VDQQSGHLSNAEIEQYGSTVPTAESEAEDRRDRIEAHLADCPACRERVLSSQRARLALLATSSVTTAPNADRPSLHRPGPGGADLKQTGLGDRSPDCPDEDDLRHLAAGLCPLDQATQLTQHASQCDHCGPLLRMYVEDFSDEVSKEDEAVLGKLKSASAGWQKRMARHMSEDSGDSPARSQTDPARKPFAWRWALAPTAMAACAAIVFAVWYSQRETPEKVEKLLAQAYTEQRTIEMRFPGAEWAPIRVIRGPEDSRFSKPAPLLDAEGIIGRKQPAYPNNVEWLRAKAQADILERKPEPAIACLNQALEAQPESVQLMLDLSIAYYQQGEISQDPQNYEKATDLLGKVLQKEPGNQAALFNRALLNEQMMLIDSAIADWESFLKNEKDPGWVDEGRKKLSALQELKRKQSSASPRTLEQWRTALNSGPVTAGEEALDAAVLDWLPKTYPIHSRHSQQQSEYAELLGMAAKKLQSQHGDNWLAGLLRLATSPNFAQAISELRAAVLLNSQGKAGDAINPARKAEALFRHDYNWAGLARAQLEEVYGYQRSGKGADCLDAAAGLHAIVENQKYSWIRIQLLLDEASCFNILGRLDEARVDSDDAVALTGRSGYRILCLRALGVSAGLATTRGDALLAVKQDLAGLQEYWVGSYPIQRAYQFYSDLTFNAEGAGLWHLAFAGDQEAVWAISQTTNKQVEGIARYRLAKAAIMVGQRQIAEVQMRTADALFQGMQSNSARTVRFDGMIGIVRSYINLGDYETALTQLDSTTSYSDYSDFGGSQLIARRLAEVKGDIEIKRGNFRKAREAYSEAVSIAESSLTTLHDDIDRIAWSRENAASYRALAGVKIKLGDDVGALEVLELFKAAPLRTRTHMTDGQLADVVHAFSPVTEALRKGSFAKRVQLGPETTIAYALIPEGLAVWVLNESGVNFKLVNADSDVIRQLARQFSQECSNPSSDVGKLRNHGKQLYQFLIAPIRRQLQPGDVLVFETDDDLEGLPLAAVVSDTDRYLIEEFAIRSSPGLAYRLYRSEPRTIRAQDRAVVVGDPTVNQRLKRILPHLPSAHAEAEMAAAQFHRSTLLVGRTATFSRLIRELPKAEVFHFAGHAIQSNSGPALVLAPENSNSTKPDMLAAGSIYEIAPKNLKLVILSACATGQRNGHPLIQAFLLAGNTQVVSTLWTIDSMSTREFMSHFYENLLSGGPVHRSLRIAALELSRHPETSHPYYWAAFSLA
jgi:CHAT domain-containing protein/tetratricopeptide (TPR) repeat protein